MKSQAKKDHPFLNAGQAGVYRLPLGEENRLETTVGDLRFIVLRVECASERTIAAVLRKLGETLKFPEWYGNNFDALVDCLTDPDWQPPDSETKGHILVLKGLDTLRQGHPKDFATLLAVLRTAADARREAGAPLWILSDSRASEIPPLPDA